jgi:hypothetical protein
VQLAPPQAGEGWGEQVPPTLSRLRGRVAANGGGEGGLVEVVAVVGGGEEGEGGEEGLVVGVNAVLEGVVGEGVAELLVVEDAAADDALQDVHGVVVGAAAVGEASGVAADDAEPLVLAEVAAVGEGDVEAQEVSGLEVLAGGQEAGEEADDLDHVEAGCWGDDEAVDGGEEAGQLGVHDIASDLGEVAVGGGAVPLVLEAEGDDDLVDEGEAEAADLDPGAEVFGGRRGGAATRCLRRRGGGPDAEDGVGAAEVAAEGGLSRRRR